MPRSVARRALLASAVLSLAGLSACLKATEDKYVQLRLSTAVTTTTSPQQLVVNGAIDNVSDEIFRTTGCARPQLEIDSLTTAGAWVPLDARQFDDLMNCVTSFNVAPGQTQTFQATFVRADPAARFPRAVSLRLRAVPLSFGTVPAVRFALP